MYSSNLEKSIGVFDSGIGGLTVLKELKLAMPNEKFVYLGDTARTPYGSKGYETIVRYSKECAAFLLKENIKLLVVACNTASSLALASLVKDVPCPVVGTIEHAVSTALKVTKNKKVGVIGTEATIASGVYQNYLQSNDSQVEVKASACPLFVPLVEQGMFSGKIVDSIVEYYLDSFRNENIDTLILGCTHYPLLKDAIERFFNFNISVVECSKAIAMDVKARLEEMRSLNNESELQKIDALYVTDGVSRFNQLATFFLGGERVNAIKVDSLEAA